jgi:hypothetical protein
VNEYPFAERDGCGLTLDDWASFLGLTPDTYTGPALLWWALAGGKQGVNLMHPNPFPDLLTSMASDTHALATLATSSQQNEVRALAPALHNLHRRLLAAAEMARRAYDLAEDDRRHPPEPPPPSAALQVCRR